MTTKNIEDIYPLSPMQQGMLFHSLYEPSSGVYFEQISCRLVGTLNVLAFEHAWNEVFRRHSTLRTSFVWEDLNEPLQIVHRRVDLPIRWLDWCEFSEDEIQAKLDQLADEEIKSSFDLTTAPLMRLVLVRISDDSYQFIWCSHHLLLDGWSLPILLKEVFTLYEAYSQGQDLYLKPARPYRDYIGWLQGQDIEQAAEYWKKYLEGFNSPTTLARRGPRSTGRVGGSSEHPAGSRWGTPGDHQDRPIEQKSLDVEKTRALRRISQEYGVTLNTIVQGAWAILLSRYCDEEDVVFGATVAGRPSSLPYAESMLGLFINTLPVRAQVDPGKSVIAWLKDLQSQQAAARQFEYTPLVQIQSWSELHGQTPLFDSILVFENYPIETSLAQQRGSLSIADVEHYGKTNYPLTIVFAPGDQLIIEMVYDPDQIEPNQVSQLSGLYSTLLERLIADPEQAISSLGFLTEDEERQLVNIWSTGEMGVGSGLPEGSASIYELIEQHTQLDWDAPAAVYVSSNRPTGRKTALILSYGELLERADVLARYLQVIGVKRESLVGIYLERSFDMLVALLAVLKSGGAYVPLDPKSPWERVAFMMEDAGIEVLLTHQILEERWGTGTAAKEYLSGEQLPDHPLAVDQSRPVIVLKLDVEWEKISNSVRRQTDKTAGNLVGMPDTTGSSLDPAYVIYTSGTTGTPKGVVVTRRSLYNHALNLADKMRLRPSERMAQLISIAFDASGEEIYPSLITGATLILPDAAFEMSGWAILNLCDQEQVTHLHLPAPLWHQCVDELVGGRKVPASLHTLLVGGESPSIEKLRIWSQAADESIIFLNAYGPTEATITTTIYQNLIGAGATWFDEMDKVPIGRPIAGARVLILDKQLHLAPVGMPGEIYIAGVGLARGYLNRPDLTVEKFIPDPFSGWMTGQSASGEHEEGRLYRTGDRGLYLPDGNIEFIGRVDNQVKLRGFRIELEEIEANLRGHPDVQESIVIVREDRPGDKQLVGYISLTKDSQLGIGAGRAAIDDYLAMRLPDYMIPTAIVILDEMPLTSSGKVDRKALPAVDTRSSFDSRVKKVHPRDVVEEIIAGLWAEVLGIDSSGIENLGVHDNFFELGGHSLKATQLLSRIRQTMQVEIPLRSLFESPTIAEMAGLVSAAIKEGGELLEPIAPLLRHADTGLPIEPVQLSFSQQRLWFLDQLDPGNLSYIIPTAIRISGELDIPALHWALIQVIQRHEALRTTFDTLIGKPVQRISQILVLDLPVADLAALRIADQNYSALSDEEAIQGWIVDQIRQPFNLHDGPLIRAGLLITRGGSSDGQKPEHIFVLSIHHIVTDGWSMGILINELVQFYVSHVTGQTIDLPDLPIQYADYAEWQRGWLSGDELSHQLNYWEETLASSPPLLELPTDRPRPAIKTAQGGIEGFSFSAELSKAIQELARQEGVTVYMLILAAFQTLLYRYSGQEDISFGSVIASRIRPEIEGIIGFFVNTIVLRTDLSGNPGFRELLQRVREVALGAFAHQDLPFEMLVEALKPERNLSYTPLFQVGFDWQETAIKTIELPGLMIEPLKAHGGAPAYDLLMAINQSQAALGGTLEFNSDLFDASTIHRMLGHFRQLIESLIDDPDQMIDNVSFLTEAEKRQILVEWNTTESEFHQDRCIHELFEAHASLQHERAALIYQGLSSGEVQTTTYGDLNRRSNRLARYLRSIGIARDGIVGISMERSLEMIVSILGVLKAGGAYLPLDPHYPPERLAFMVEDAQIPILITQKSVLERHSPHLVANHVICLDIEWDHIVSKVSDLAGASAEDNISLDPNPENLAYVIYTSGSTGKPKGTLLRHRGLCNLVEWQRRTFEITPESRVLQFSPFSFDASVWEMFMALANGATLCLASQEILASGLELVRLLGEQSVTTVTLPPSVLAVLPAGQINVAELPALRTVIAAGEACRREIVLKWAPGRRFFNAYGPTETTVCASAALCDEEDPSDPTIGRPIANTRLYVLDRNHNLTPVGVPGELYVGGVGLAKGYLNRVQMTEEKFIANPLAHVLRKLGKPEHASERLYRTGDLVRYRPDGNLEFLGRIDQQVKVRGFRIELGEIEAALRQFSGSIAGNEHLSSIEESHGTPGMISGVPPFPRIQDAAVVVREEQPGDRRLVAFVVTEKGFDVKENEIAEIRETDDQAQAEANLTRSLKQYLRNSLPEYMVPSTIVVLEALPLTPSGKVDRGALMDRSVASVGRDQLQTVYEAPRTETEMQLCQICASLLGIEFTGGATQGPERSGQVAGGVHLENTWIGIHDNFFELGGHSLLATQFISRIRDNFQVEIPLRTLFEHPTIADLSAAVDLARQNISAAQTPSIRPVSREARRMRQTASGFETTPPQKQDPASDADPELDDRS